MDQTKEKKGKKLGEQLYKLLISLKKRHNKFETPKFPFSQSLNDNEFIELVKQYINYCENNKTLDELTHIRNIFEKEETNIKELFTSPELIKDIMENSILSILVNPYDKMQLKNNISFLSLKNISFYPLINIPFIYNNKNIDLNKEAIIADATSFVPLHFFHENMNYFINNYQLTINQLKNTIKNYINQHHFYFCSMKDDIQAFTIHTGDIFINLKYIKEYFDKNNEHLKFIIREKIILAIFHELNQGLIREIDINKKNNFFNNNSKRKRKLLKFKNISNTGMHYLPNDESGNYFDFLFYNKYYIDQIDNKIAELYLNIRQFSSIEAYLKELEKLVKEIDINEEQNIFKFKKNNCTNRPQCLFSLNRSRI